MRWQANYVGIVTALEELLGAVSAGNGGGNTQTDTLLADIKTQLQQVYGAIDELELTSENVSLNADQIKLDVDGVETKLQEIFTAILNTNITLNDTVVQLLAQTRSYAQSIDSLVRDSNTNTGGLETLLATIESLLSAEGADVGLMRTALAALKVSIEAFQTQTGTDLAELKTNLDDVLIKLNQIYGSCSNIDSSLVAIELQNRPLSFVGSEVWGINDGEYVGAADSLRRGVNVVNNTGEANGRNAATLFVAYNGNSPDRINHVQFIRPGESAFLDCPALEFHIVGEGVGAMEGFFTVVRFE